jgi:superfamily II DNA or RNA helicase
MSAQSLKILVNILHQNIKNQSDTVLWQLFEYYCCYKHNFIPWNLMTILKRQYMLDNNIPCKDYGIDGISDDFKQSLQSKFRNNSSITYTELSTFFTTSKGLLNCDKLYLDMLETSKPTKLISSLPIEIIKYNKDKFLNEVEKLYNINKNLLNIENKQNSETTLRYYQKEAIHVIMDRIRENKKETHEEITCAGGKGFIIKRSVYIFNTLYNNPNILILVPSILLCERMKKTLINFNPLTFGGKSKNGDNESNLYICVYNSIFKIKDIKFDYIFIDEGHHLQTKTERKTYRNIIQNLKCKHKIFLTATCKPNVEINYKYTIEQGIKDGFINDYDIIVPKIKNLDEIRNKTNNNSELEIEYIYKSLVNLIDKRQDIRSILAFCNKIEESIKFCEFLNKNNIPCQHLDGKMTSKFKENVLSQFELGTFRVVSSVYVLGEGLDLPFVDCCLFVSPRNSYININQCVGRTLRILPEKGLSHVILPHYHEEKQLEKFIRHMTNIDERLYSNKETKELDKTRVIVEHTEIDTNISKELIIPDIYFEIYKNLEQLSMTCWHRRFLELKKYDEEIDDMPSKNSKNKKIASLGRWVNNLRLNKRAIDQNKYNRFKPLTDEQIKLLESLPHWYWDKEDPWRPKYVKVKNWSVKNKRIARTKCNQEKRKLNEMDDGDEKEKFLKEIEMEEEYGQWCAVQREIKRKMKEDEEKKETKKKYRRKLLTEEQIKLLEEIPGWYWDKNTWTSHYEELKKYVKEFKEKNKGKKIEMPKFKTSLGRWCSVQRCIKRAMKDFKKYDKCNDLTDEQIKLLEKIEGWKWNV